MSGPVKVSPAGAFAELLASPTRLLDVTMDQLRTLLAVREAGSPLRAARRRKLGATVSVATTELTHPTD